MLAILCKDLSSSTNLFHENKSTPSREHPIGHDRSCCCDLQDDAYERNDVWREAFVIVRVRYIQPLFVFWQISLRVRFDNRAIRHGLLADSQMNEFAVNRRDDASTHKSFVVQVRLYQSFRAVSLSLRIARASH